MEGSLPEGSSLPDRRRHGYKELEDKLDEHAAALEQRFAEFVEETQTRFARFFRGALIAFAVMGLLSAGSLVGFGFLLRELSDQADEIQAQRQESILRTCGDQNKRHDKTVTAFYAVADEASKKHPEQAAQIQESVKANLRLINALVPKQKCEELAALAVKTPEE